MKYLGIDYGEKKVGLALADEELEIATPFKTITAETTTEKIEQISSIIENQDITQIVIGLPLSTQGEETSKSKEVRGFTNQLKKEVEADFEFVDERFSSQEADSLEGDASRDEKSAMLILDTYL
ncbi:MAG: Holliday junction resolvase RuvX [Candidatus Paceibacteria bacterium]